MLEVNFDSNDLICHKASVKSKQVNAGRKSHLFKTISAKLS